MNKIFGVFMKTFLIVWIFVISLLALTIFIDMDLDKTKEYWCENGFDNLDCGYSLRWTFAFSIILASLASSIYVMVFPECTVSEQENKQ